MRCTIAVARKNWKYEKKNPIYLLSAVYLECYGVNVLDQAYTL